MVDGKYVNPAIITGSWFPSGFYGHYRSKSRNDVNYAYRQLAKPQPPRVFITRMKDATATNVFSKHDNRFSYMTDATFLDQGVGKKRRINTSISSLRSQPGLLAWTPTVNSMPDLSAEENRQKCLNRPTSPTTSSNGTVCIRSHQRRTYHDPPSLDHSTTHYRSTYTADNAPTPMRQLLYPDESLTNNKHVASRPPVAPSHATNNSSSKTMDVQDKEDDDHNVTAYRFSYGQCDPHRDTIQAMHLDALRMRPFSSVIGTKRGDHKLQHVTNTGSGGEGAVPSVITSYEGRESVAECLVWHKYQPSECTTMCKKPLLHRRPKTCCFGEHMSRPFVDSTASESVTAISLGGQENKPLASGNDQEGTY